MIGAAALIVLGAYVVYGMTGFGSTVLSMPLLAQMLPLKFAVPLMLLLDLTAFALFGARLRRGIRFDEIGWLAAFMLAGMVLGLTLLIRVSEQRLLAGLGLFVLAYAAYGLTRRGVPPALARAWCGPIGLAGGALSAMFGTGGVLFAIFNSGRIRDKGELRATNAATIMASSLVRVVLFGATGLLSQDGLVACALLLAPAVIAGVLIGNRLHAAVPAAAVVRVVYLLLVIAGLSLLVRAAAA
ncbi:MAG TPA: sulfite exporter TauE/SafE family protein [Burkholderiales bacterium]|nr:sulfite exporter TauE/SafE family protein [Burkholderiales bacterium]